MSMIKQKTKTIVFVAIFSAIFYLFSIYGSLKINNYIKITFQNLPIYISGILFGALVSSLVGTVGMFISQLLTYGITSTTILWVFPYTVAGFLAGTLYKKYKDKLNNNINMFLYLFIIHLVITVLNIIALYIDSKVFGYYNIATVFFTIPIKLVNSILISILYTFVIPVIVKTIKRLI